MFRAVEKILLTLWVGGMWTAGYVVAPLLFKQLDRMTAGNIAGQLFTIISYIGLVVILAVLLLAMMQIGVRALRQWRYRIVLVMLLLVVIEQFGLQPVMVELKAAGLEGSNARQFASLHAVASILYLINSVLGLALVAWRTRSKNWM